MSLGVVYLGWRRCFRPASGDTQQADIVVSRSSITNKLAPETAHVASLCTLVLLPAAACLLGVTCPDVTRSRLAVDSSRSTSKPASPSPPSNWFQSIPPPLNREQTDSIICFVSFFLFLCLEKHFVSNSSPARNGLLIVLRGALINETLLFELKKAPRRFVSNVCINLFISISPDLDSLSNNKKYDLIPSPPRSRLPKSPAAATFFLLAYQVTDDYHHLLDSLLEPLINQLVNEIMPGSCLQRLPSGSKVTKVFQIRFFFLPENLTKSFSYAVVAGVTFVTSRTSRDDLLDHLHTRSRVFNQKFVL